MTGSTEHLKAIIDLLARNDVERTYERARQFIAECGPDTSAGIDALVKALRHAYQHLAVTPVHIFVRGATEALGAALADPLRQALESELKKTEEWRETLRALGRERYARETRALIRGKRLKEAAVRIQAMVEMAREEANAQSVVGYLGTTLGTLDHDQDLVDQLMDGIQRAPERFGMTGELAAAIDIARKQQFNRLGGTSLEGREREFNRVLTQAIVDLRNRLSTDLAVGEPTEEETSGFYEELHALFRAYMLIGRGDFLLDIVALLVELTPRDRRTIGPAVASEERLFLSLNPRQRLVCVRSLRRLGDIPRLVGLLLKFSKTPGASSYAIYIVEVMGGLGSREFFEFILSCYQNKDFEDPRFSCIDALGRIQHEGAIDLLIKRIGVLLRAKPFDPPKRREAEALSVAVGRVSRSRNVSIERRNEIIAQIASLIPESDTQMGFSAARDLFGFQPQNLDQRLINWAMGRVVQALWSQDQRPEFARAAEGTRAVLGFRQEIVDLAVLIGQRGLEGFVQALEAYVTRFSGAFFAAAEILEKIGDERAVPVLKKMIVTSWMSNDNLESKYYQETYYDTATQTRRPMTRDKIIHALLYVMSKVGGASGMRYVVETAQQVRTKQLDMPGDETGSFLMQQLIEHGSEVADERARLEATPSDDLMGEADHPLAKAHIQEVIDMLRARYLLANARRQKKIPAIQEIARRRHVESLDLVLEQLNEKDPMIRSAATIALLDFGAPGARESTLRLLAELLIERLGKTRNDDRDIVRDLIKKLNPRREPFRTVLLDRFKMEGEGGLKAELSRILRTEGMFGAEGTGTDRESPMDEFAPLPSSSTATAAAEPREQTTQEKAESLFDARRQYFKARKAWLDGGKKGDPPLPPEGV